jgi:two-component system osmolarity sensor histidine kinase EnvZ
LVLHSKQEYFFTGRRQRLISQALGRLQSLLDRQRANFQRTRVEASERALIARGFLGAKTIHDLMGPLGVIQKQVELLSPQADPSSVVAKGLDRIARLTHKIVTLLKDRAKGIDLDYTICGIDIFLSDIFRELESSCDPSIVTLKDVVPDTKVRVNVWLRAAVSSLLENAVESAGGSHGGVCMAIGLDPRQIDRLLIVIENDGPEYSLEQIERMKTPGHSTKGSAHLGLGVPLAEAGIRNAGGDMALKPRHKGGLVAEIVLPIVSYK